MARLNIEERKKLYSLAWNAYTNSMSIMDINDMCAYCMEEVVPGEILMRKYRIVYCINILNKFGLGENLTQLHLPNIDNIFWVYNKPENIKYDWYDYLDNQIDDLIELGKMYLSYCLRDTNWQINYMCTLEDYEILNKEEIQECTDSINFHWEALNIHCDEEQMSEYLTSLGCEPLGMDDFYPAYNLILRNERIKEAMSIWKSEKKYQEYEEYKEFQKVRHFILLDRYFIGVCNKDMENEDWVCISYIFGTIVHDKVEETGLYQLNYEAVIFLILADMIAADFLERYHEELSKESVAL